MGDPTSSDVGLITAIIFVGGFVGAFFASPLADRYGRRPALAFGSLLCVVGAALQSAAQEKGMFIGGRLIIGFGISFTTSAGPSLLNELAHPRMRGQVASMVSSQCGAYSQHTHADHSVQRALVRRLHHSLLAHIRHRPPLLHLVLAHPVHRARRARRSRPPLRALHARIPPLPLLARPRRRSPPHPLHLPRQRRPRRPLVAHELQQIHAALAASRATITWPQALRSRAHRARLGICVAVAVLTLWTGQGVIAYYFSPMLASVGIAATAAQTGINGGMQVWNFVCALAGALLADRVGRRPLWLLSFGGMIAANVPLVVTSARYAEGGSKGAAYATVVFLFLYNAAFNLACNPLVYAYPTELLPYGLRTKGLSLQIAVSQAALTVNNYVNPIALEAIGYWFFVFYLGMLVAAVGIVWKWFPETKGKSLEELATLFEDRERDGRGGDPEVVVIEGVGVDAEGQADGGVVEVVETVKGIEGKM